VKNKKAAKSAHYRLAASTKSPARSALQWNHALSSMETAPANTIHLKSTTKSLRIKKKARAFVTIQSQAKIAGILCEKIYDMFFLPMPVVGEGGFLKARGTLKLVEKVCDWRANYHKTNDLAPPF
jgi:hypothetical protein